MKCNNMLCDYHNEAFDLNCAYDMLEVVELCTLRIDYDKMEKDRSELRKEIEEVKAELKKLLADCVPSKTIVGGKNAD